MSSVKVPAQSRTGSYGKVISEGASRRDFALGDPSRAIHVIRAVHVDTMEMQAGTLGLELVVDVDDDTVALGDVDGGGRPLAIDADGVATMSCIRIGRDPGHVEIIGNCSGAAAQCSSKQEEQRTGHGWVWREPRRDYPSYSEMG